jgi:hypothetical protein
MENKKLYKICSCCKKTWTTKQDFLADISIVLNGYQADIRSLDKGLLLFTHIEDGCNTTMATSVTEFKYLYKGARYIENKALFPECPRYCIDEKMLNRCEVKCECAFEREITQAVLNIHENIVAASTHPDEIINLGNEDEIKDMD